MESSKATVSIATAGRVIERLDLFERNACRRINRFAHRPRVRALFAAVSRLGDGVFWYSLMLALPLGFGRQGAAVSAQMVAAGVVALFTYKWLKSHLVRERPFASDQLIVCTTAPLDRYSFPSGHTLHAVLFTTLTLTAFPVLWPVLIPFALLVALSRVVLGLHYPTDVLVGAAIGFALARLAQITLPIIQFAPAA